MYREPTVEKHQLETIEGNTTYTISFDVNVHCIQTGTYSSTALDPDEYFGVYKYDLLDIRYVEAYDESTDELTELDIYDLPDWIIEEVEREIDSFN